MKENMIADEAYRESFAEKSIQYPLTLFCLVLLFISTGSLPASEPRAFSRSDLRPLMKMAQEQGTVNVLVELDVNYSPEGHLSLASRKQQRRIISQAQQKFQRLTGFYGPSFRKKFSSVPMISLKLTPDEIKLLENVDLIKKVYRDGKYKARLTNSIPYVQADELHSDGDTGANGMIAVMDTGIDTDHSAFGDRLKSQACFSSGKDNSSITGGDCPNGKTSQTGTPAGQPLKINGSFDDHGSHVAGIALGQESNSINFPNGVAPGADIASIMVFHDNDGISEAHASDLISGLEYVADTIASNHDVVAVNMSLGGAPFENNCDDSSPVKPFVNDLRSKGIVPVAATGNDGSSEEVSAPACVSNVVAVGSSGNLSGPEEVSNFSNISPAMVNLVAPGEDITSAVPNNDTGIQSGTSMSAPHVTGAFALLKQRTGTTTDNIQIALTETGETVPDNRIGAPSNAYYSSIRISKALQLNPAFDVRPETPTVGETLTFENRSTFLDGSISGREWDFDDGNTSDKVSPVHTYAEAGTPEISLTIESASLAKKTITQYLDINALPQSDFTFSPARPSVGDTVEFSNQSSDSDGTIQKWQWEFGDENSSSLRNPTHNFSDSGTFPVQLTVTDDRGETQSKIRTIPVGNVYPSLDRSYVTNHRRLTDTTASFGAEPYPEAQFTQISLDRDSDFDTKSGDLTKHPDGSCTNPSVKLSGPLLNNGQDTLHICIWTNQSRFAVLYGLRTDTPSLNTNGLPTNIPSSEDGLKALSRTALSLEFADSEGRLIGDTSTTSTISDSFTYTLIHELSEETAQKFEDLGFSLNDGSDDFRFYYADTYGSKWIRDESVSIQAETTNNNPGSFLVKSIGVKRDLPGALGGVDNSSESSNSSGGCLIERYGGSNYFTGLSRDLRDHLLRTTGGRTITQIYYSWFGDEDSDTDTIRN